MTDKPKLFSYRPDGVVLTKFFWDRDPVSIIQGPIGSGTSTACMQRLWHMSLQQAPGPDGVRRTRWLIIRNTYGDLKDTTMKTWSFWFEETVGGNFGEVAHTRPPRHHIKVAHPDRQTLVDCEVIFLALDVDEDVRKLMSSEPTGVFFNEMQFTQKALFDEAQSRVALGRYPPLLHGGPTWHGIIGDLNAPTEGHWIPYMRGDVPLPLEWDEEQQAEFVKPNDWNFYIQPAGLLEEIENGQIVRYVENNRDNRARLKMPDVDAVAENQKWLSEPYTAAIKGKSKEWIDARVMNRVGLYRAGKPVFERFQPALHIAEKPLEFVEGLPLIVGLDFARNPAAVFCQNLRGQLRVLDELGAENVSAVTFAPMVRERIAQRFPEAFDGALFYGDPTGRSKGQGTDLTPYQIFAKNQMLVAPAPGNNRIDLRINTIDTMLMTLVPGGGPKLLIDPRCRTLKTAMNGGYHYKKIQGQQRHHEQPHKDRMADYADALQYAALGAGYGTEAVAMPASEQNRPIRTRTRKFSLRRAS